MDRHIMTASRGGITHNDSKNGKESGVRNPLVK